MTLKEYKSIIDKLYKFAHLGVEKAAKTGAIKIGKAPYIAPEAVINSLYPPIRNSDVDHIEEEINIVIPDSYRYFLTNISNGLEVMTTSLCLYGMRANFIRNIEWVWQPFSLSSNNKKSEKPFNADGTMLFIGGYDWDGSHLYMTPDNKVHYCSHDDASSLLTWPSLRDMLETEIDRLYTLYDANGVPINEDKPTTPFL